MQLNFQFLHGDVKGYKSGVKAMKQVQNAINTSQADPSNSRMTKALYVAYHALLLRVYCAVRQTRYVGCVSVSLAFLG
jgi:hypothetical protein